MGLFRVLLSSVLLLFANFVRADDYVPVLPLATPLPVELYLAQKGLIIDIPPTGTAGGVAGGLLSYAVESGRNRTGNERITGWRELLDDYDFNARYLDAFRRKFPVDISPDPRIAVLDIPLRDENFPYFFNELAHPAKDPPMGLVLKVQGKWAMSYSLQKLYVRSSLFLVERSLDGKGQVQEKILLSRAYSFDALLDREWGLQSSINQHRWEAIGKTEMQRLLDLAIEHNMDMMAYDFSPEGRAMLTKRAGVFETMKYKGRSLYGRLLRETPEWYWAYPSKDEERYLPRSIVAVYPLEAKAGGEALKEPRRGPPVSDPARRVR